MAKKTPSSTEKQDKPQKAKSLKEKPEAEAPKSVIAAPAVAKPARTEARKKGGGKAEKAAPSKMLPSETLGKVEAGKAPSASSSAAEEKVSPPVGQKSSTPVAPHPSGKDERTAKAAVTQPGQLEAAAKTPSSATPAGASTAPRPAKVQASRAPAAPEPVRPAAKTDAADVARAAIPSESEFVAAHPTLPEVDLTPESLAEEILPAPAEQPSPPPATPHPAPGDWEGLSMSEPEYTPEPEQEYHEYHPTPSRPSLYIVQITPELAPVAKVGGLADVVFGLSNEMEIRGNHVEVILPKYDCMRYDHIWGLCETYRDLWVPWYGGAIHCTVFFGFVHGRKCFFIEPHSGDNFFNRGCVYGFNDDVMRFAFFTRAAMEFLWKSGKNPDIIHCHDWQTALAPVFLYEIYQHMGMWHPRVCFTIHNFKHQGVTGAQILHATGLNRPEYYSHYDRLRDNHNPHAINLMKGGVVYSNFVTTVSPRHAFEAKDQGQGFGLESSLHIHHGKYGGVVNGIDYSFWNPELDHHIPFHYSVDTIDDKYKNKRALRDRLLISDNEKPIVAFVGRLDPQKGLELIRHAIFYTLHRGGQFVLLGSSPDGQINNYFWSLKHQLNENPDCHIEVGFNEELSHLIYAGADMMLVPSRFEPCGLTQLISLRYGTIPVVREIGGLADTVFDKDFSHRPLHERNGYVFRDYNETGLESALGRAISCYYEYPEHFRELMKNAMRCDYSWNHPGQDYLNIYDLIRDK